MPTSFTIRIQVPASAKQVYHAWTNSKEHSLMTGAEAICSPTPEAKFSAWDGYIFGEYLELDAPKKIKQTWRTTDFNNEDDDSIVEIKFLNKAGGCEITLHHSNIPEHQPDYKKGWQDFYFEPMLEYFRSID